MDQSFSIQFFGLLKIGKLVAVTVAPFLSKNWTELDF